MNKTTEELYLQQQQFRQHCSNNGWILDAWQSENERSWPFFAPKNLFNLNKNLGKCSKIQLRRVGYFQINVCKIILKLFLINIICFRCDLCGTLAEGFFTIRERSNAADKVRNAELRHFGRKKCVRIEQILEQPDTDSSELSDFPDRSRTKRSCSVRRIFENSRRREIEIVGQDFRIGMFRTNLDVPRWSDLSGSLSGSSYGRLFDFRSKKFEKSNKLFLFGYCYIILSDTWFGL